MLTLKMGNLAVVFDSAAKLLSRVALPTLTQ